MTERVKPFWLINVTLITSAIFVLAACGSDSKSDDSNSKGGNTASNTGGSTAPSAGNGDKPSTGSGGSTSTSKADSGTPDGSVATGTVKEGGACKPMADSAITGSSDMAINGKCIPTGSTCNGYAEGEGFLTGVSSDCAEGLSCCIDTDNCEKNAASASNIDLGTFSQFIKVNSIKVSCIESTATCPAPQIMMNGAPLTIPAGMTGTTNALRAGCPNAKTCCIEFSAEVTLPEGGIGALLEAGVANRDAGAY